LGGITCLSAVLRDPTGFDGPVLIDSAPQADPNGVKGLAAGARHDFPATVQRFVDACIPGSSREHLRHWGRQILLRAEPEAAARMMEAFLEVAPNLAQVDVPTLVVHGSNDLIIPIEAAKALASGISGAELVVIDDAGHVPTITRPSSSARSSVGMREYTRRNRRPAQADRDSWAATLPAGSAGSRSTGSPVSPLTSTVP
jgi:pimeloyl-ACP methyl ester carboxylesterase